MKKYRVSRVSVMEAYGSSHSAFTTCAREFDSIDEAMACVEILKTMFPKSYVSDTGSLVRNIEFIHKKTFNGMDFNIVHEGSVFWMILEHGDGLPMPIDIQ